jgi:beta-glucosidase
MMLLRGIIQDYFAIQLLRNLPPIELDEIMAQATFHFPRGFLWGTATAAHQVEGNNTNNQWWAWEQEPGRILEGSKSGLACDWWNGRWREDFDRAAETFQNAHRLSVEWSRIQPTPDRWDEEALDRYLEILRGLQERGIMPMITLHHFTDPLWISESGGWENEETVKHFEKFVRKAVETFKDYVSYWTTINEPNLYAFGGYLLGNFPPGQKSLPTTLRVMANLVRGHAAAYHAIHEIQPTARVGIAHHYRGIMPAKSWSPLDRLFTSLMNSLSNEAIPQSLAKGVFRTPLGNQRIPQAKGTQDYIGINYYTIDIVGFSPSQPGFLRRGFRPGSTVSKTGFLANEPEGMFDAIRWARQFGKPILITENGIEDADDSLRPAYLAQHIHQMWRAVNFNYPVKGYFHWSLVDNFEWERGWSQRFGLWALDEQTQGRRKRPSADLYGEICQENGLSSEMVARYAPQIFNLLFPN